MAQPTPKRFMIMKLNGGGLRRSQSVQFHRGLQYYQSAASPRRLTRMPANFISTQSCFIRRTLELYISITDDRKLPTS